MHHIERTFRKEFRSIFQILYRQIYGAQNEYMTSSMPDVNIPSENFIQHAMKDFHLFSNHIATECASTGRKYTFGELDKKSSNFGKSLRKYLKLCHGDTIAILLPNVPEYPICMYGLPKAGLRITTINAWYSAEEIQRHLIDADVKAIITLAEHHPTTIKALYLMKKRLPIVIIKTTVAECLPDGTINFHDLTDSSPDVADVKPLQNDDTFFLPYSSGTTGLPKGVMLTGNNLLACFALMNAPGIKFFKTTSGNEQEITPHVLPMYHIYGFSVGTFILLQAGVKIVTIPKFTPESYVKCLEKHRPSLLTLVPPLVIFLHAGKSVNAKYLENVRTVVCGAAPLGKSDEDKLREKIAHPIKCLQGYGLTETTSIVLATPDLQEGRFSGSMGHPLPNTLLKLVKPEDPEINHLGPNEVGEILVKGPQIMKGYFNRPVENRDAFVDGWFRTGDLARYNERQFFYIVDRIKELIKVKGYQVAPAELEEVIRSYPGVADAGVIGIPHRISGEVPRAYIVPKSGQTVQVDALREYIREKVAPHKRLDGGIIIADSIPKSPTGKILRRQLKLQYEDEIKSN